MLILIPSFLSRPEKASLASVTIAVQ